MEGTTRVRFAGFFPRLAAYLIDAVLVSVSCVLLVLMLSFLMQTLFYSNQAIFFVLVLLFNAAYEVTCIGLWGATIGKRLLGLVVVHDSGAYPIGFFTSIMRFIWKSVIPIFLSSILILFDPECQAAHDKLAGTYVIYKDSLGNFRKKGRPYGPGKPQETGKKKIMVPSKDGAPPLEIVYGEADEEQ